MSKFVTLSGRSRKHPYRFEKMLSQVNYLIRSQVDGKYLVARTRPTNQTTEVSYLLLFQAYAEALSYINTHGAEFRDRLAVESITPTQLKGLLKRWGYQGIALVEDPLIPQISFMSQNIT